MNKKKGVYTVTWQTLPKSLRQGPFFTLKILNIRTPKKFAVITLKFEQYGFTEE